MFWTSQAKVLTLLVSHTMLHHTRTLILHFLTFCHVAFCHFVTVYLHDEALHTPLHSCASDAPFVHF